MISEFLRQHGEYLDNKSFRDLTTIKMGGPIRHFVMPYSCDDLKDIVGYLKENHIPFKVIGNGSNMICGESPYDGVVISLKKLNNYEITNSELYAEAGTMVPMLANSMAKEGLSGLEFASGIPGTLGGLVYMNAGAYKRSMSDVIEEVLVLRDNEMVWLKNPELNFSYRTSLFQEHPHWVILAAKLKLENKNPEMIMELMNERLQRRKNTQPLEDHSAGSCFRNPENDFAWKMIDSIGYRGYHINDVFVSDKHSNFIVNKGNGKANEYLEIVYAIQEKVKEKYNVKLVLEVEKFNC